MKQNTTAGRIADRVREQIRRGSLRPGDRVPSARQLARDEAVALATAMKVLSQLQRERLVRVVPGVGTVVRGREDGPELSRERVVRAAIAIADDDGLAALSMRAVATELGVATMSLYRHVPGKDELVLAMIDAVMNDSLVTSRPALAQQVGWRARLEQLARMHWELYTRHPWLAPALSMTRPQLSVSGMQHTEWVLAALLDAGFSPAAAMRTCVAFMAHVRGMAMSVEPEREAERDTGMNSEEWMADQEQRFAAVMPRFPALARISEIADLDMSLDALFECGLACFLAGIEVQLRASEAEAPKPRGASPRR
ncbi:TetR/AcrR family transcriptional regulator C-terminal domain-containing protein [Nannocystis punicea]|uniref:TetR/AcrR family transcriptional regulator C-terminal domain-containing protein n=1 Tax=Nannocystis punicea TaxID=2995304 RepID=A0ABY7HBT0_9BACT|nr:TetR/AcrR family transcriptional regulator C-terminal domain-containing protein [Nannocystis poenicansa]WAS96733.1 TetR/AcrR family transcriptional regulator C-terminal domain-containing protein [Nannocystis poenicansa]